MSNRAGKFKVYFFFTVLNGQVTVKNTLCADGWKYKVHAGYIGYEQGVHFQVEMQTFWFISDLTYTALFGVISLTPMYLDFSPAKHLNTCLALSAQ